MAEQRVDASLDAFDALIADLADAGEIAPSELVALRSQQQVPHTGEISLDRLNRWAVHHPVVEVVPVAEAEPKVAEPAHNSAQPMTRREARALREAREKLAAEGAPTEAVPTAAQAGPADRDELAAASASPQADMAASVEAENARRTAELIHSHRVRPAGFEPAREATPLSLPKRRPRNLRRSLFAGVGAMVLVPSLWMVVPATADTTPGPATTDAHGHTAQQILTIADDVHSPTVDKTNYVATAIAAIVAQEGGASATAAGPAIVDALSLGGSRAKIVETALSYVGTPYVLDGSTHTGIDCSGLTMVAYAAVGINLVHIVGAQDRVGTRIPESEAQPGDVVVFNNEDHIGIYLGDNQVLAAPAPGRRVSIESVDVWRPVGIHFTRLLPAGQ